MRGGEGACLTFISYEPYRLPGGGRKRQAWKQRGGHRGSEPVAWTALVVLKERRMYFQGGAHRICWELYMEGERKTEDRHDFKGFNLSNWRKSLAECRRWWGRKALNNKPKWLTWWVVVAVGGRWSGTFLQEVVFSLGPGGWVRGRWSWVSSGEVLVRGGSGGHECQHMQRPQPRKEFYDPSDCRVDSAGGPSLACSFVSPLLMPNFCPSPHKPKVFCLFVSHSAKFQF